MCSRRRSQLCDCSLLLVHIICQCLRHLRRSFRVAIFSFHSFVCIFYVRFISSPFSLFRCVYSLLSSCFYARSKVSTCLATNCGATVTRSFWSLPLNPRVFITQCIFLSKIFDVKFCYLIVIFPSAASWQNRLFIKANMVRLAEITQPRLHCYANGGRRLEPERYFRTFNMLNSGSAWVVQKLYLSSGLYPETFKRGPY